MKPGDGNWGWNLSPHTCEEECAPPLSSFHDHGLKTFFASVIWLVVFIGLNLPLSLSPFFSPFFLLIYWFANGAVGRETDWNITLAHVMLGSELGTSCFQVFQHYNHCFFFCSNMHFREFGGSWRIHFHLIKGVKKYCGVYLNVLRHLTCVLNQVCQHCLSPATCQSNFTFSSLQCTKLFYYRITVT